MKKHLILLTLFVFCVTPCIVWSAEESQERPMTANNRFARYTQQRETRRQVEEPIYPLFRPHPSQYYPEKNTQTAILLSATLPGLGQVYGGSSVKGFAFLVVELGLLSAAGFNLDRAVHYDDFADRFATGFHDPRTDTFLTREQGRVKSRSHTTLGALFLAAGIGLHVWNILDAAETVKQYNKRRFTAQVQQTGSGETYLSFVHRY